MRSYMFMIRSKTSRGPTFGAHRIRKWPLEGALSSLSLPLAWLPRFSEETRNEILAAIASNGQVFGPLTPPKSAATSASTSRANQVADEPWSDPLDVRQAPELFSGLNAGTKSLVKRIAENYDPKTGRGTIGWSEAKALSGATDYKHLARGHLSGLTRRLRNVTGDPSAVLLVENEDWIWAEGATDWTEGTYYIDGPAILALRKHFGLAD